MVVDDTDDVGRTEGRRHLECPEGAHSAGSGPWGAMEGSGQGWGPHLHHETVGEVEGRLDRALNCPYP